MLPSDDLSLEKSIGKEVTISGIIAEDVVFKKNDYRIRLNTQYGDMYIMVNYKINASRSDKLTVQGKLQSGFGNYIASMYRPNVVSVAHSDTPDWARSVRDVFSERVQSAVNNEEQTNLALSYLTGQKSLLTEKQKEQLRLAGLAHVVVASGYHLSIVVNLAKKRFGKVSRFATMFGASLMMLLYISVTGFSPSMTRAGLVTFLSLWAWYFGRRFHPIRLILYVAAISLIINPSYIFNIAWQLSFASYSGIMLLSPLFAKFFYGDKQPSYFASIIIASISAQIFCLPISIYHFGSISLLALLSNIIITPIIPMTMLLTTIVGITMLAPIAFILSKILEFQLFVIDKIATVPWSSFELPKNNPKVFFVFIVIIIALLVIEKLTHYSYRPCYASAKESNYDKIYAC